MTTGPRDPSGEPLNPRRTYLLVCLALLVLSGLSLGLAQLPLGGWETVLILLIAAVQAALIGYYYMRIRFAHGVARLVAVAALVWLAILMVGTLDDVLTRGWIPVLGK